MTQSSELFDRHDWERLVETDADIATATAYLRTFGENYVADLAESYLAIGEKRYLPIIVAKIKQLVEDERRSSRPTSTAGSQGQTSSAPELNDDADAELGRPSVTPQSADDTKQQGILRISPQFDSPKWKQLASEDTDIAGAIASIAPFGNYYAADLAASYQAIDDKRYLWRIVSTILAEAEAERIPPHGSPPTSVEKKDAKSTTDSAANGSRHGDIKSSTQGTATTHLADPGSDRIRFLGRFQFGKSFGLLRRKLANLATELSDPSGTWKIATLAAAAFLLLWLADLGIESFAFQKAHGNADRLEAYVRQCWTCAFKNEADAEGTSLRTLAGQTQARNEIATSERERFRNAQGDISDLESYVANCTVCNFKDLAQEQIAHLRQAAADASAAVARRDAQTANEEAADLARQAAQTANEEAAKAANEEKEFFEASGNIGRLNVYLEDCSICVFKIQAQAQLQVLRMPPKPVGPPRQVIWRITNSTGLQIGVTFFSKTRPGQAWPGPNLNWPFSPGQTVDENLSCQPGENICYGAYAPYRSEIWGVGPHGDQACDFCCYPCDGAVHSMTLFLRNTDEPVE